MPRAASVRTGPGRDRVDADPALAEVPRQVAHDRLEGGLRDAHHVVAGHRAVGGDVRQRHDRAAAAGAHVRLGLAGERGERVGRDVDRQVEALAARVDEAAAEVLGPRVRDGVDEGVEAAAERLGRARHGDRDLRVVLHVERQHGGAVVELLRQLAHLALGALALVRQHQPVARLVELARDRPGDAALVGHADDQAGGALEELRHRVLPLAATGPAPSVPPGIRRHATTLAPARPGCGAGPARDHPADAPRPRPRRSPSSCSSLAAATAAAHPALVTTSPLAGTSWRRRRAAVQLTFSEPVELAGDNSGDVFDESGASAARGPAAQGDGQAAGGDPAAPGPARRHLHGALLGHRRRLPRRGGRVRVRDRRRAS